MGKAKLNVWIRDEDCSLRNAWMADLEIKTCLGENIIDLLPETDMKKIIASLEELYPDADVTYGDAYDTKTIKIYAKERVINHIPIQVPPGCYVARVHVCGGGNEWSDRTMVIASCAKEVCVNLIIKEAETCVKEVIVPILRVAEELKIPVDQLKVAVGVLGKVARVPMDRVRRDLDKRVELLKDAKEPGAAEIIKQARFGLNTLKDIRLEKKRK